MHFPHGPPPPFHHGNSRFEGAEKAAWENKILPHYLKIGAIRPAQSTKYVSRAFFRPKKDGGLRLVIDLRHLNSYCKAPTTKYETLSSVGTWLEPDSFMVKWDI